MNDRVTIVGAGLAGCEAAWQLVRRGHPVKLIEMKPEHRSPAHVGNGYCELVCSNSLKAEVLTNASGLLKEEMRAFGSLILEAADATRVPAGGCLAVDRNAFSEYVTKKLRSHPLVETETALADRIPEDPAIIATGPLTDPALTEAFRQLPGFRQMHFFDAEAPIISAESINMEKAFTQSRYDKGGDDYVNCPMTEDEYNAFYDALTGAELAEVHDFEKKMVFEGCLAVEILASRGRETLAFGPLKPVGLVDPRTGKQPYAVVQLRREDLSGSMYNMVGFQTRLKWGEQKRVFGMIPGLENAEFLRYGVMHKNTYLNSPDLLGKNYMLKNDPFLRFAGQLTGVEGYMESAASGLTAGLNLALAMEGKSEIDFTQKTILGALAKHVITETASFQPMNANFGILEPAEKRIRGKRERYQYLAERSLETIRLIQSELT